MSLIGELKRRSVFKVGAAYLVVGWLVIQAASIALPSFEAPAWAMRTFILIVALGFPIALVMAWVFDVTPEGVKLDPTGVGTKRVFTAAAILAALAVGWFMRGGLGGGAQEFDAPLGPKSTAVLPFVNMSSDKENEYFSDGLTETLLHKLAQVAELKVAARTSSFAFKDKQSDIRAIGRELGVATVVEGSVQRAGDTLRITAQLVRTADGSHIWSRNYDRKVQDLFAIQDEIAGAVTEALIGALAPEAKAAIAKGGTQDLQAYDLYTKALARRAVNSFDALKEAEALLTQAVERDPKFVDAMTSLMWTWTSMAGTGIFTNNEANARIDPMLDRLEALDPTHAHLLVMRGVRANVRNEHAAALAFFERGLAAAPADSFVLMIYALNLDTGVAAEGAKAIELMARAVAIDPLNPLILYQQANLLEGLKRSDEAIVVADRLIEVAPTSPLGYQRRGELSAAKGLYADEFIYWRKSQPFDPTDHELASELALQLDKLGDRATADLWLAKAQAIAPGNFYPLAMEVQLAFRRGDLATAYAKALPLIPRHDESRRGNWSLVMAQGCMAASELGKGEEFRLAMVAARQLPVDLSQPAFEALLNDRVNAAHLISHFADAVPCVFGPEPGRAAQFAAVDAIGKALIGAPWTAGERNPALQALVTGDRARFAAKLAEFTATAADLTRIEHYARWAGVADDPALVKAIADRKAPYAAEAARLPSALAAAGVSAAP
jgi:TolB-like protein/Flp pilus assembly protein TadD